MTRRAVPGDRVGIDDAAFACRKSRTGPPPGGFANAVPRADEKRIAAGVAEKRGERRFVGDGRRDDPRCVRRVDRMGRGRAGGRQQADADPPRGAPRQPRSAGDHVAAGDQQVPAPIFVVGCLRPGIAIEPEGRAVFEDSRLDAVEYRCRDPDVVRTFFTSSRLRREAAPPGAAGAVVRVEVRDLRRRLVAAGR